MSTGEDLGVLFGIPKENPFAFNAFGFCPAENSAEGTTVDPFTAPTSKRNFLDVFEVLIEQ